MAWVISFLCHPKQAHSFCHSLAYKSDSFAKCGFTCADGKQHLQISHLLGMIVSARICLRLKGKAGVGCQLLGGFYLNPIDWQLFNISTLQHFQQQIDVPSVSVLEEGRGLIIPM